jgi:hypothetical protein
LQVWQTGTVRDDDLFWTVCRQAVHTVLDVPQKQPMKKDYLLQGLRTVLPTCMTLVPFCTVLTSCWKGLP